MSRFRRRLMMAAQGGAAQKDYLKFEILTTGTVSFVFKTTTTSTDAESISYSLDNGETWTIWENPADKTEEKSRAIYAPSGTIVLWKGVASCFNPNVANINNASKFGGDATYNISGNILSLLSDNFENITTIPSSYCFTGLFANAKIVDASQLKMPLTNDFCYRNIFYQSTMTVAPKVLPTANGNGAYFNAFSNCKSLIVPPELPATTLGANCYCGMFDSCSNLQSAPTLPFTGEIPSNGYRTMFKGCGKIDYIKSLHTSQKSGGMYQWVQNVAATGIFVKNINATWTDTGVSGVPTGWTLIYYDPSTDKYYLSDKTTECDDHGNVINA